jgi:hypothetical protein
MGIILELISIFGGFRPYLCKSFVSEARVLCKNRPMTNSAGSWNQEPYYCVSRLSVWGYGARTLFHNQYQISVLSLISTEELRSLMDVVSSIICLTVV